MTGEQKIKAWFESKGWQMADFQLAMLQAGKEGKSGVLNAPTGMGKTYGGFLPVLADYMDRQTAGEKFERGLRLIWITPLRALAKDIQRNMQAEQ